MGYCSEVCLRVKKYAVADNAWSELKDVIASVGYNCSESNDYYEVYGDCVKYYTNCGLEGVDAIESLKDKLDEYDYQFICIGENVGDIEVEGRAWELGLTVVQKIDRD